MGTAVQSPAPSHGQAEPVARYLQSTKCRQAYNVQQFALFSRASRPFSAYSSGRPSHADAPTFIISQQGTGGSGKDHRVPVGPPPPNSRRVSAPARPSTAGPSYPRQAYTPRGVRTSGGSGGLVTAPVVPVLAATRPSRPKSATHRRTVTHPTIGAGRKRPGSATSRTPRGSSAQGAWGMPGPSGNGWTKVVDMRGAGCKFSNDSPSKGGAEEWISKGDRSTPTSSGGQRAPVGTVGAATGITAAAGVIPMLTRRFLQGKMFHDPTDGGHHQKLSPRIQPHGQKVAPVCSIRTESTAPTSSLTHTLGSSSLESGSAAATPAEPPPPLTEAAAACCKLEDRQHLHELMSQLKNDSRSSLEFYSLGKQIGEGSFAKVRIAKHKLTGAHVAVKTYERSKIKDGHAWRRISQEVKIMEKLEHPRIVRLYETIESPWRVHLVMEACCGGNLCSYVKKRRRLDEVEARHMLDQILQGIEYLHGLHIAHRDIKLENVLLENSGRSAKLVDFGFSTYVKDRRLRVFCGTPSYMAPEIIRRTEYAGKPVDIWSLGVVLYALLCGCFPFVGSTHPELYKRVLRGSYRSPEWLSPQADDLIRRMLSLDPSRRLTVAQVRAHPFLQAFQRDISRPPPPPPPVPPVCTTTMDRITISIPGVERTEVLDQITARRHSCITTTYHLLQDALRSEEQQVGSGDALAALCG